MKRAPAPFTIAALLKMYENNRTGHEPRNVESGPDHFMGVHLTDLPEDVQREIEQVAARCFEIGAEEERRLVDRFRAYLAALDAAEEGA